jgi:hypothetical protein
MEEPLRTVNGREVDRSGRMHCNRCDRWKPQAAFKPLEPEKGHLSTRSRECMACTRAQFAKLQVNDEWQRRHLVGPYSPEAKAENKLERILKNPAKICPGCRLEYIPKRKNQTWHSMKCKRAFKYREKKKKAQALSLSP